jgi:outer membrane lipoprotein SlyB
MSQYLPLQKDRKSMQKVVIIFLCTFPLFFGCESKAGTGALVGGGTGALAGGLIAGSGTGVLIGAAAGTVGGAIIGASLEDSDRESLHRQSPHTLSKIDQREPLTVDDIKEMTQARWSDQVIINQIDATHSVFYLSTADIIDLKNSEVSQKVIDYMIKTGNQ